MLLVLERPVVEANKLLGDMVRAFDSLNYSNRSGLTVPKTPESIRDGLRGGTMSAAGVG
jgi:hypothetical protein